MVSKGSMYVTKKGSHPVITLAETQESLDKEYGFSFGLAKARLIMAHISDIQKFLAAAEAYEAQQKAQKAIPQPVLNAPAAFQMPQSAVPPFRFS